jgi:hypothetical protein
MKLKPVFKDRGFYTRANPKANLTVDSLRWSSLGGCSQAEFTATGPAVGVWEFAEYLRCPVEVYDEKAQPCWWGYVSEVKISSGALEWGVSLDEMYNRVAVAYSFIDPGSQTVGQRKTTAWSEDADSVDAFGHREMLATASGLTDAAGTAHRDTVLASFKYPGGVVTQTGAEGSRGMAAASITCRGWYDTLDWQYANVAGTSSVATTTQITNLETTYGEFITAVDIDTASGVNTSEYRNGDTTVLAEIAALLDRGTSAGKRLLATVGMDRRLLIYPEPDNTVVNYSLDSAGYLYNSAGRKVTPYQPPFGVWVKLRDVLPSTVDTTRLINPTLQFVDGAEWSGGELLLRFRGQRTVSDILGEYE